jgi:lipoprotein-anchoring transpeptidase ErfK/SrfK
MSYRLLSSAVSLLFFLIGSPSRCWASPWIVVSVPEQQLCVIEPGGTVEQFPVSTSRVGLGDRPQSFATPLGNLAVADKVGAGAPAGTVFKACRRTGEVLRPNAPGRDPIVTRILRLRGLEPGNAGAYGRCIYIHGTPVERLIGRPVSYGCIRMRSKDIVRVFESVPVGARVQIVNAPLRAILRGGSPRRGAFLAAL